MSEHLDAIRRGHEAFNTGDLGPAKDVLAEDVEWGTTGQWPGMEGTYRGRDALDEWVQLQHSEFEGFSVSLEEVLREEEDAIAVAERLRGRGRGSGASAEMRVYSVYWFDEDGLLSRRQAFTSAEEAIAAI
jgi:ketosteroid isomerase-like protein